MDNDKKPIILAQGIYAPQNRHVRVTYHQIDALPASNRDLDMVLVETPIEGVRDAMGEISWMRCYEPWAIDVKIDALVGFFMRRGASLVS